MHLQIQTQMIYRNLDIKNKTNQINLMMIEAMNKIEKNK